MRPLLVGLVIGIASVSSRAHADCAPQPSVCYCPDAVAVVDGHVEVVGETFDVRIDVLARDASDVLPGLAEGDLITIQPEYQAGVLVGNRVLFGIDGGATLVGDVFVVSASNTVSCSMTFGHEAAVSEATGWLLAEAGQCRAALEKKGWMAPCDDTRESCSVAPVSGDGARTGWALLFFAAVLGWARRRR